MDTNQTTKINEQMKSHFIDLYSISLSDSNADTKELELLYDIGLKNGVNREQMDLLLKNPHKVKAHIPTNEVEKIEKLYDFTQMVLADGIIDIREVDILKNFCRRFGFIESNIQGIVEFLIEECKKGTSKNEILDIVQQNIS